MAHAALLAPGKIIFLIHADSLGGHKNQLRPSRFIARCGRFFRNAGNDQPEVEEYNQKKKSRRLFLGFDCINGTDFYAIATVCAESLDNSENLAHFILFDGLFWTFIFTDSASDAQIGYFMSHDGLHL
jgi:hypothetical protein